MVLLGLYNYVITKSQKIQKKELVIHVSQKGTPTLPTVTLERINGF